MLRLDDRSTAGELGLVRTSFALTRLAALRRYAIPGIVGIAPVLTIFLTWQPEGSSSSTLNTLVKALALPMVCAELLVCILAIRRGAFKALGTASPLPATAVAILLCIAFGTAFYVAPDPSISILRTIFWCIHILFAWSLAALCIVGDIRRTDLTDAILAGFTAACAALLIFVLRLENPQAFEWTHGLPGYDNVRRLGYYAAAAAGLSAGALAGARTAPRQAALLLVCTLAFAAIFWSGSRGAVLAFAAALVAGILLFPSLRRITFLLTVAAAALTGALLAQTVSTPSGVMGIHRMLGVPEVVEGQVTSGLTSGRTALWMDTFRTILERPLFGYGEGQTFFVVPLANQLRLVHPHNIALQTLLAWGIVGTALLLVLVTPWTLRAIKNVRAKEGECLGPSLAMLVLLIYAGGDGTLFHVQSAAIFAACAAMVHSARSAPDKTVPHS